MSFRVKWDLESVIKVNDRNGWEVRKREERMEEERGEEKRGRKKREEEGKGERRGGRPS